MVTLRSENRVFDTVTPSCYNSQLLKLVYSLWYDRLVVCLYGDLKLAIFKIVLATLKSENMVFGNFSLYGVNSHVSRFAWRLFDNKRVMCLYGDLKLAIFKIVLATLKSENMVFGNFSLYGVNSYVSRFVWRLLYNIWNMWHHKDFGYQKPYFSDFKVAKNLK